MPTGTINPRPSVTGSISNGSGGTADHNKLIHRDYPDQHPIEAITDLQKVLNKKLDSSTAMPLIDEALKSKAKGLFYGVAERYSKKPFWYLTSEVDANGQGTKESIISGPYDLGQGGGGGGSSITVISLLKVKWPANIAVGSDCEVIIKWTSLRDDEPTGQGTIQCYNNGKLIEQKTVPQGEVSFNLKSSIISGDNKIEIKITDAYGGTKNLISTITGVSIELKSYFDANSEYTGEIPYIYTPYGAIAKTVHFIIDGVESGQPDIVTTSGEQKPRTLPAQVHGHHTLLVYFTANIDGEEIKSNELYYDLICYEEGNTTPIIASTFLNNMEEEQYIPFNVKYRVYTPGKTNSEVYLYIDGKSVYTKTIQEEGREIEVDAPIIVDKTEQNWEVSSDIIGDHILKIKTGLVERTFNFHTYKSTIDVKPVTDGLELYLSTENRNNQEAIEKRVQWNYEGPKGLVEGKLTNFNWTSNGWVLDDNNKTVLRLSGAARATVYFKPFENDFTRSGKTFEFEIATRDVKDYEERIIQCLDGADAISYTQGYAGEDTRQDKFRVSAVDNDKFFKKVQHTTGTYIFIYDGEAWNLDDTIVSFDDLTNEYGITLEEIGSAPDKLSHYLVNDRIIIYYTVSGHGFYITPQVAKLQSQQSSLSTQYKEDDKVRISFVVEKAAYGTRLLYMYINGIISGVSRYSEGDSFAQTPAKYITIGSDKATIDIYNIRIYNTDLTRTQIVNNWIADTKDAALKAQRYKHNDVYNTETGQLTKDKVAKLGNLPYMTIIGDELPKQKKDRKWVGVEYVNPADPERDFISEQARMDVQGTSSQYYYKKNFKIKFEQGFYNDLWGKDPETGINGYREHYKLRGDESKKEKTFVYKADVASSEGANNVELVRYFEDSKNWYSPPEMEPDTDEGTIDSKKRIRVGIDGLPIVMFHNDKFYGKMNFNNDKGNERTFGFKDGDECWEFLHNSSALVLFKSADLDSISPETGQPAWMESFEARFPEEVGADEHPYGTLPAERQRLRELMEWVVSTYRKPTDDEATQRQKLNKFKADFEQYFDLTSTLFYYLYTELFLMVDSRAKNAMMCYYAPRTGGDGRLYGGKWYWLPYDMDTALGINNEGLLVYNYDKEDTDLQEGAYIYNGQDSTFWKNVRDAYKDELREMYVQLRSNNVGRTVWSFGSAEQYFEDHQAVWCENIFNEDAYVKYLEPYILNNDATYLGMAQGSKLQQRRWWMYNRFKYLDSKYRAPEAKENSIMLRAYNTAGQSFKIVPYTNCYITGNFWEIPVTRKAEKGRPVEIASPGTPETGTDAVINIFSADWIQDIGDISSFKPGYADFHYATKLQRLIIGNKDSSYENGNLKSLNVGANKLLTYLDARNCQNLGSTEGSEVTPTIDLKECISIEEVYFAGTQIKGVNFPNGGNLQIVQLPSTITQLTIRNHPNLKTLDYTPSDNLTTLWLENIPNSVVDSYSFVMNMKDGSRIRLIGIDNTFDTVEQVQEFFTKLNKMRGLDSTGYDVDRAQVTGTIRIHTNMSYNDYKELQNIFPEVKLIPDVVRCTVNFYNYENIPGSDNLVLYKSYQCNMGGKLGVNVPNPQRVSSIALNYQFNYWYLKDDETQTKFDYVTEIINSDLDIYPKYLSSTRTYTVKYNKQTAIESIKLDFDKAIVDYNTLIPEPTITGIPEDLEFHGWHTVDGHHWDFAVDRIQDDLTLYAYWVEAGLPNVELSILNCNTFRATCTDAVGITAWAVTHTADIPTSWNILSEAKNVFIKDYNITTPDAYYFWVRDNAYPDIHYASAHVQGCAINKDCGEGINDIKIYYKNIEGEYEFIDTTSVFSNSEIKIVGDMDTAHYQNLLLFFNDEHIQDGDIRIINSDVTIKATCIPRIFTITFNMNGRGTQVEPREITYNHTMYAPTVQFEEGYLLDRWLYNGQPWKFESDLEPNPDRVQEDMILDADWIVYTEPTEFDVTIKDIERDIILYCQTDAGITQPIEIDWGDGSPKEIPELWDKLEIPHTYQGEFLHDTKDFTIKVTLKRGNVLFGWNSTNRCFNDLSILKKVRFAANILYTNDFAFCGAENLVEADLTSYMTKIATGTFMSCPNLQINRIPDNLTEIGSSAFEHCNQLSGIINLTSTRLLTIGNSAFANCENIGAVNMSDSITRLGSYAFSNCKGLRSFNLPANITELGDGMFTHCESITTVNLSDKITTIGSLVFADCYNLEKVIINAKEMVSMGTNVFDRSRKLVSAGPIGSGCSIEFNWNTKIPANAFYAGYPDEGVSPSALSSIIIPETITEIGSMAFKNTKLLHEITLPYTLNKLGNNVFEESGLVNIDIPEDVRFIGSNVLSSCWSLVSINIYSSNIVMDWQPQIISESWVLNNRADIVVNIRKELSTQAAIEEAFGKYWNYVQGEPNPMTLATHNILDSRK